MRKVPLWLFLLTIYIFTVVVILFGWSLLHIYQHGGERFNPGMKKMIVSIARLPTEVNSVMNFFVTGHKPGVLLVKNTTFGNGLTYKDKTYKTNDFLLVSSFDSLENQSVVKLLQLNDGKVLHKWVPDIPKLLDTHKPEKKEYEEFSVNESNYRILHPLLLNNGDIVFNDRDALMKIDRNSKLVWYNNQVFHHSVEMDADGNIWVPSVIDDSRLYQNFGQTFRDDAIAKISPSDGKVLFKKSVAQIFKDNGYEGLLLGVGPFEKDPVHLNDIQPAFTDSKYWLKGDLLISLRHRSTVFLYRPSTNKILWLKTGPWFNQHDCNFLNDHQISIFANNVVRDGSSYLNGVIPDGHNEEIIYDFSTGETSTPYTKMFKDGKIGTKSEGRGRILDNGDLFVEETNYGRIVIGDTQKVKIEYVERLNDKEVSMFNWCRYMTAKEVSAVKL